jgi:hypothetical protein
MKNERDSSGFFEIACQTPLSELAGRYMPATSDRFNEAVFFAKCAIEQQSEASAASQVNWYVGAHFAAFISITDAASVDYRNLGRNFNSSPLHEELKLQLNDDPVFATKAPTLTESSNHHRD